MGGKVGAKGASGHAGLAGAGSAGVKGAVGGQGVGAACGDGARGHAVQSVGVASAALVTSASAFCLLVGCASGHGCDLLDGELCGVTSVDGLV